MSKFSSKASPNKAHGVNWWQQSLRSFITPYGEAKSAPEPNTIFRRLQPFTSEWLSRPDFALWEYSETVISNLDILKNSDSSIITPEFVATLDKAYQPLLHRLEALNKKQNKSAQEKDAKEVVKHLISTTELDSVMQQAFHLSGAIFAISANYIIASTLLRNPIEFARIIASKDKEATTFKATGEPRGGMRSFPQCIATH